MDDIERQEADLADSAEVVLADDLDDLGEEVLVAVEHHDHDNILFILTIALMEKIVKTLQKIVEIRSIYRYQPPGSEAIVVVTDSIVDTIFDCKGTKEQRIILTTADLMQGKDVFNLNFIHIAKRSTLLYGQDMLWQLEHEKKFLRQQIESVIRHLMIDMREQMMCSQAKRPIFQKHCYQIIDRIVVGILVLLWQKIPKLAEIGKELVKLEHVLHHELWEIRELLLKKWRTRVDCKKAHNLLLVINNKIDTINV